MDIFKSIKDKLSRKSKSERKGRRNVKRRHSTAADSRLATFGPPKRNPPPKDTRASISPPPAPAPNVELARKDKRKGK